MGEMPVLARVALHFDEEPCISGRAGSGAVFFSGCALKCVFCQNEPISHRDFGRAMTPHALRVAIEALLEGGAHNVNFVNPTHYAHAVEKMLEVPFAKGVVWNSSGYESVETLKRLAGKVQIYMPDIKYVSSALSKRYAGAVDYFERARPAVLEMARQVGAAKYTGDGLMTSGLIVRHLILPGCAEDSMRVLDFIARELPDAVVSLMAQYVPCGPAREMPELNRRIAREEYDAVLEHLFSLGIENGYVQELASADERYIPAFDLTGVGELWDNK
jgi:putative pyruvate formate lyase activating enzyme